MACSLLFSRGCCKGRLGRTQGGHFGLSSVTWIHCAVMSMLCTFWLVVTLIRCHEVTLTMVSIFEERITFIIYTNLIFRQINLINAHSDFVPQVRIHCVLLSRTRYDDGGNRPYRRAKDNGAIWWCDWLIAIYDLLKERRINDVTVNIFTSLLYEGNRFHVGMRPKTTKCGKNIRLTCQFFVLTTF